VEKASPKQVLFFVLNAFKNGIFCHFLGRFCIKNKYFSAIFEPKSADFVAFFAF